MTKKKLQITSKAAFTPRLHMASDMSHMECHVACHLNMNMWKYMKSFTPMWHGICDVPCHLSVKGFINLLIFVFK